MQQARCSIPLSAFVCLALLFFAVCCHPPSVLGAGRVIGVASSMVTIFPESPPAASDLAGEFILSAARGESQSAQVVMVAGDQPLDIQRVEVSDLRQGSARIGKGAIEVRLVAYVEIKPNQNNWRGIKRPGLWPDPLIGFRPFTCPAGETRSLWVTAKVPATATPGQYQGSIKLYSAGSLVASVPIKLTVWRFTLPEMPSFATNYWTHTDASYDYSVEPQAFIQTIRLLGDYRVSTNIMPGGDLAAQYMRDWSLLFYLEPDGSITADISGLQRTINAARQGGGVGTFEIGDGCWWGLHVGGAGLIDRQTGLLVDAERRKAALDRVAATLPPEQLVGFPGSYFERLYLPPMCDWLQSQGLLERSFIQLYDESPDPAKFPEIATLYQQFRSVEPRMKLLGLTTIHPGMAGVYDIWSPDIFLYDPPTYDLIRTGQSLYGPKSFPAAVTASSSGTGDYHLEYCQPIDAYDGLDYRQWVPKEPPTADKPQWIRFDFKDPSARIDGLRVVAFPFLPWDTPPADNVWVVEGSLDGQKFSPLSLTARPGVENGYSFPSRRYKSVRLSRVVASAAPQDIPALNQASPMRRPDGSTYIAIADGIREVEFLRQGVPLEATRARARVRPAEMWEYSVGAGYPSICVDADASEIRAIGWQSWARGVRGYLNYGGGQWDRGAVRPKSEDPVIWTFPKGWSAGEAFIIYPGQKEALPSVRLARFRDAINDFDYLEMLAKKQPDHPVLKQLRDAGRQPYAHTGRWASPAFPPYNSVENILAARQAVGEALDKL